MKNYILMLAAAGTFLTFSSGCASEGDNSDLLMTETTTPETENDSFDDVAGSDGGFTGASPVAEDMEIIFEDDFENTDGIPDQEKWSLCERSTSNWARYLSGSYDQAYTSDGSLFLIGELKDGEYLTGGIETRGKFEFEHGVVECRARFKTMPQGGHTGIWMMPAPPAEQWPKSGEIDIMEHLNKESKIYETVHSWYADDMGHKEDPISQEEVEIKPEEWNIYGIKWTDGHIIYTVNGKEYLDYHNLQLEGEDGAYQWPFNHPFYIILSQSLGGEGTWAGPIDNEELPAIFEIDWIRVTRAKQDNSAGIPTITAD